MKQGKKVALTRVVSVSCCFEVSVEDRRLNSLPRAGSPNPVSLILAGPWPGKAMYRLVA